MTTDTTRTLIEAGMIPETARLSAADRQTLDQLSPDEVSAIIALRFQLSSEPTRQDGHVPNIIL
jgi:hypothetical protein